MDRIAEQVDILFVIPTLDWQLGRQQRAAIRVEMNIPNQETPNIGIGYLLGAAQEKGIKAKVIDMVAEGLAVEELVEYVRHSKPSFVGFPSFTIQIKAAAHIASEIKRIRPNTSICVGGPHVKAMPRETLEEFPAFDFVLTGEGEKILPRIIETQGDIESLSKIPGVVTRGKEDVSAPIIRDLDAVPFPDWHAFDLSKYGGTYPHRTRLELPMVTARGCPFECTFCCNALGRLVRRRSVDNIISEMQRNVEEYGCESIAFLDETFYLKREWMEELCEKMESTGLNKKLTWSCSMRVSGNSQELFDRMARAGCYYIFFGLESANEETLRRIKKKITVSQMADTARWAKRAGIVPVGAFIIGLEGADAGETDQAIELGRRLDLYSITFPIAVPFPGTSLRELAEAGRYGLKILSNDWDLYGKQDPGVMESPHFSWAERRAMQKKAYAAHPKKKMTEYLERIGDDFFIPHLKETGGLSTVSNGLSRLSWSQMRVLGRSSVPVGS